MPDDFTPYGPPFGQDAARPALEYDPNRLFDALAILLKTDDDAALAQKLQVIPSIIGMIRAGSVRIDRAALLVWLPEATGMRPRELEQLLEKCKIPSA